MRPGDRVKILAFDSEVGDDRCLHIVLSEDGSVSRMGTSVHEKADGQIHLGKTREPLFRRVMDLVPDELWARSGTYAAPSQSEGKRCTLALRFWGASGEPIAVVEFLYSPDSQGPPAEIRRLVEKAIEVTDPWFELIRHGQGVKSGG